MMHCHESQLKQTDDMTIKKYWFFTVRRTLHCASLSEALTLPGTSPLENACRWAAITRTNYTLWHKSMGNLFLKIAQHGNIPGNICHLFYRLDIFFLFGKAGDMKKEWSSCVFCIVNVLKWASDQTGFRNPLYFQRQYVLPLLAGRLRLTHHVPSYEK